MNNRVAQSIALAAAALFIASCDETQKSPAPKTTGDAGADTKKASAPVGPTAGATTTPTMVADEPGKMRCFGANTCSGQTACNVADGRFAPGSKGNACAGQNECKGKGWLLLPDADCKAKGGTPL